MKRISIVLAFAATACGGAKPLPVISPTSDVSGRATWSDGWLVVRDVDGGGKITETYLRAPEGQRLYVVVQLEMPRFGRGGDDGRSHVIEIRRVYDPATGS